MSLRLRHLHLRIQTAEGLFGTRIRFSDGLVLLRADNSMGKSTCVQSVIYALGLERMLGPSSAIPLPHVMTTHLADGDREIGILESEVLLEIENHRGEYLTIQRTVLGERDTRLVTTWEGPRLTNPAAEYPTRDYYVRDPGSAKNEAGFSRRLGEFIGWQLPTVRRFNGTECPLYLEATFPLFVVEQKHGWAGIQANLPTYLGIREMAKRCVDFVLDLDVARLVEERQRLEQEEVELRNRWKNLTSLTAARLRTANARIVGLPDKPTAQWPLSTAPMVEVFRKGQWIAIETALNSDKEELRQLHLSPVPTAGEASLEGSSQLEAAQQLLSQREVVAGELRRDLQREQLLQASIDIRIAALHEDLRRNKDVLKLKSFGSQSGWKVAEHECPTCHQQIADTLLPQTPLENPMSIEENIRFIESQVGMFENLHGNSILLIATKESELATLLSEMEALRAKIRALRQTLLAPNSAPSYESVRVRLETDSRIRSLDRAISEFHESLESFAEVAEEWRGLLEHKRVLPSEGFSEQDKIKMARLGTLFREQVKEFGFSSHPPDTLEISRETYRPTREGFDLGFDLSASDNIRTIWAYLQGLLELSAEMPTNHIGLLIFDEPRQQEAAELSFEKLLARAATAGQRGQQIVFATSEPLEQVQRMLDGIPAQLISYNSRVISRME